MASKKIKPWGAKAFPDVTSGATELGAEGGIQKGALDRPKEKHLDSVEKPEE